MDVQLRVERKRHIRIELPVRTYYLLFSFSLTPSSREFSNINPVSVNNQPDVSEFVISDFIWDADAGGPETVHFSSDSDGFFSGKR